MPKETQQTTQIRLAELCKESFLAKPFRTKFGSKQQVQVSSNVALMDARGFDNELSSTMNDAGIKWVGDQVTKLSKPKSRDPISSTLRWIQLDLLKFLHQSFSTKALGPIFSSADEEPVAIHIKQADAFITSAVEKAKKQKYSIAFCGMVKAGKSLFLNALIGRVVLPSDDLPSTAWPCRVRHIKGRMVPTLELDVKPFQDAIVKLQGRHYAKMMANYTPPSDDPFAAVLAGTRLTASDTQKLEVYNKWADLHQTTKDNLTLFENPKFKLPGKTKGEANVAVLLGQINDVVRLCKRFDVTLDIDPFQWPLLTVEFETLRNMRVDGIFEFIDLPGIGESFADYDFEELVSKIAKEIDVIVPIISFKEVSREDWRHLPQLIKNGMGRPADIVVCTHLDQYEESAATLKATVASLFWPRQPAMVDNVLACSSKLGLSARYLRRKCAKKMPPFSEIWRGDSIEYECAKVLLGVGSPEMNYKRYKHVDWIGLVNSQINRSGIQTTQDRLTTDIIRNAQQRALLTEGARLRQLLRKVISGERRLLLTLRRTRDECETAFKEFGGFKSSLTHAVNMRVLDEQLKSRPAERLRKSMGLLDNMSNTLARNSVDATIKSFGLTRVDANTLSFSQSAEAKRFYNACQERIQISLKRMRHDYVSHVRDIANDYRVALLSQSKQDVDSLAAGHALIEFKFEITEALGEFSERDSTDALVNRSVHTRVVKNLRTTYKATAALAYAVIEEASVKARLKLSIKAKDKSQSQRMRVGESVEVERRRVIDQLGFMLRAPLVSIATLPFRLGMNVWLFVRGKQSIHVKIDVVAAQLQSNIVNKFITDLKNEGQATFDGMISTSGRVLKEIIEEAIRREDGRYEREKAKKPTGPSTNYVIPKPLYCAVLASLCDVLAAEGALADLHRQMTRRSDGRRETVVRR